jgi:hypothetical protein
MAETSGFFPSYNGDRKYFTAFFAEYFADFIGNGIYPNPSTQCQVLANGDMTVTLKPGNAYINGYRYKNDSDKTLTLETADGVLKRIDRIVIRSTTLDREIKAYIKKGTFASTPVAPELQRDADMWELGVADIYVANGAVSISQANITDLRLNDTYCGIVSGVVDQVDTTTLFSQYQAWLANTTEQGEIDLTTMKSQFQSDFNLWFSGLQEVLDENTAGNLLNLINDNIADIAVHTTAIANLKKIQTANGTGTAITLSNVELEDGFQVTFVIAEDNQSAATTINGKSLYKPNTTDVPTLTAGESVTIWYDLTNDCFYLKNDTNDLYQQQLADRREILDIKLKLDELNVSEFLNKTGIGFFDLFEDNSNIDTTSTTATLADTDVSFSGEQLLKFNDETFESFSDLELAVYDLERELFAVDVAVNNSSTISMNITPGLRTVGEKFWYNGEIYTITGVTES